MANTITYETLYEDVLQDRLDHPTTYKEVCKITMTDTRAISTSRMSDPGITTVTRGTGFIIQDIDEIAETLTISTGRDLALFVDWADLSQSPWTKPMELFDRIGALLNEFIEQDVLAQHGTWANFGTLDINAGGSSDTQITVSASNIDDIIRGVKRVIRVANGQFFMNQNGVFFVWRAADFEILEAFVQANGFLEADKALKQGTVEGLHYLGVDHYWSNEHASGGHVFAGVKLIQRLAILRGTFGRAHTIEFPASLGSGSANNLSGVAYYSRVDIGHLTPTAHNGIVFDVRVT